MVDRIIGKADRLGLGRHSREQVIVRVVGVGLHLAQRIGRAGESIAAVVGKGGDLILRILHGEQIPVAVIAVDRLTQERINHFLEPILRIVLELGDPVERIFRRGDIAGAVIGQRRRPVERIGRGGNALRGAREQIALYISGQKLFCMASLEEDNGLRG